VIWPPLKTGLRLLSLLPLSVPGTVLGLAYLLTFSSVSVWTNGMLVLVINTVIHLFSVPFLSSSTTLLQINPHYEAAGSVSGVNRSITFYKVIVPLSQSTLVDSFFYLFTNALTTVSAVIFLYGPNTLLASIAVLNMDDAGDLAAASAMGSVLLFTALSARVVYRLLVRLQLPRGLTMNAQPQATADINASPLKITSPLH
ncbi:MAG: ABC transporter permease subunit, partial [Shewanella sp.]